MAVVADIDELIERYYVALGEFMKGNSEPAKRLWSSREDASLTNPQGSVARVGRGYRGYGSRRIDPSGWQVLMQAWRRRIRTDASNWTKISTYSLTTGSPRYQEWTGHMSPSYRSWQL
jgi:hypothetical protein